MKRKSLIFISIFLLLILTSCAIMDEKAGNRELTKQEINKENNTEIDHSIDNIEDEPIDDPKLGNGENEPIDDPELDNTKPELDNHKNIEDELGNSENIEKSGSKKILNPEILTEEKIAKTEKKEVNRGVLDEIDEILESKTNNVKKTTEKNLKIETNKYSQKEVDKTLTTEIKKEPVAKNTKIEKTLIDAKKQPVISHKKEVRIPVDRNKVLFKKAISLYNIKNYSKAIKNFSEIEPISAYYAKSKTYIDECRYSLAVYYKNRNKNKLALKEAKKIEKNSARYPDSLKLIEKVEKEQALNKILNKWKKRVGTYKYNIKIDGTVRGTWKVTVKHKRNIFTVISTSNLKLSYWVYTYTYKHTCTEIWNRNKIYKLVSSTNDNGEKKNLNLKVSGWNMSGKYNGNWHKVPIPNASDNFWNIYEISSGKNSLMLINVENGEVKNYKIVSCGTQKVKTNKRTYLCRHLKLAGTKTEIWLDNKTGILVKLFDIDDGYKIESILTGR